MKPLFLSLLLALPGSAQVIGVDHFSYPDGAIAGRDGGTGFDYDHHDGEVTGSSSDWDHVDGAPTVAAAKLLTNNTSAKREHNGPVEGGGNPANDGQDDHERSGAIRDAGRLFYRSEITRSSGATWSGMSMYNFGTERIFFGVPFDPNPASGVREFGIELPGSGTRSFSGIAADTSTHVLVTVFDYDHDLVALWVDPDPADFYDPATGTHSADAAGAYTAGDWATAVRLGSGEAVFWDALTVALDPGSVGLASVQVDLDEDGLPGGWEAANGLDDLDDGSTDPDNGPTGDPDEDGLLNRDELLSGTDPQLGDSDGDGFSDGMEIVAGSNPKNAGSYPGSPTASAVIGEEAFNYPDGAVAGRSGGSHWDYDNSTMNDPLLGHTGSSSDWDATEGAPMISGGVLITRKSSAKREHNGPGEGAAAGSDERTGAIGEDAHFGSSVVYYRFEMTRRAGATWGGASTFEFGTERFLFGVPDAVNPASENREFAIHDLADNTHSYSGMSPVTGQTYSLVAKLDYLNDLLSLYLDPDLALGEAGNSTIAIKTYSGGAWTTALRFGSGGSGDVEWDEVRAATTWEALSDLPPTANDDQVTLAHGESARLMVVRNDLGNVHPPSLAILTPPLHGTATPFPDGSVLYQHSSETPVSDQFVYEISDAAGTIVDTATVTLHFSPQLRYETNYVAMPEDPPATSLVVVDAFPGLTFDSPHDFTTIPGDPGKLFVTEGDGRVYLIPDVAAPSPEKLLILDISGQIPHDDNELALKGIAAHPDWATNGQIFLTYNSNTSTVRLSRFTCLTSPPYTAEGEEILLDQDNADTYHNISTCQFGADGYLYVGCGDEGSQEDFFDNSQHIDKDLWACIFRLDVDKKPGNLEPNADSDIPRDGTGKAYFSVPADNPFVGASSFNGIAFDPATVTVRSEIFVTGLRNPWQFSPEDHDGDGTVDEVWVGDVGRSAREEVGVYTAGQNGGWAWREGDLPGIRSGQLINGAAEAAATLTEPVWDYPRGGGAFQGTSITGGFIYRGTALPSLTGKYIFADYIAGNIWSLEPGTPDPTITRLGGEVAIVALTMDPATEDILLLDRGNVGANQGTGGIKRLTLADPASAAAVFPQTLSQTNFFAGLEPLQPNPGGVAYEPNLTFWSDFAEKSRWFLLNDPAQTMGFQPEGPWSYPEGTVWVKHFDYATDWESFTRDVAGTLVTDRRAVPGSPRRKVETRFLVRNSDGVYGVSYRWHNLNAGNQIDAALAASNGENLEIDITLDGAPATVPWEIPSRASCLTCHTPEAGHALSFHTRQLNAPGVLGGLSDNFLSLMNLAGYLSGLNESPASLPRHLRPDETTYSLESRVRSYLAVNCAYCHQAGGTGGGLWDGRSHLTLAQTKLVNGPTLDAPLSVNDLLVVPGEVARSILFNRTAEANGYSRMPPLATREVDWQGAQLLADWIAEEVQAATSYQEWRLAEFGSGTSAEGEPGEDPDGDGGDNRFEWLTNTDPNEGSDLWRPVLTPQGGDAVITMDGLRNRSVTILRSDDLTNWSPWSVGGNDGTPLNPAHSHSFTGPLLPAEFFRFRVEER